MKDPWEDWEGLACRVHDRYWEEEIAFAVALGELDSS